MRTSRIHAPIAAGLSGIVTIAVMATITVPGIAAVNDTYYSSKQPYVTPNATTLAGYSAAPAGYEPIYTEMLARHGSRGLSSYKYDALLRLMAQTAADNDGFVSEAAERTFIDNLDAITAANVENGYGMLTGQGATQHQGIGERAYNRNKTLFDAAAAEGGTIAYESSGEARATESGENFKIGFDAASHNALSNSFVTPTDAAGPGAAAPFQKSPNTLYFHKTENPDGTEKTGEAYDIAKRYEDFIDGDETIANAEDYIENVQASQTVSYDLLRQIFTEDFLNKIDDGTYSWYNTTTGEKDANEDGLDDETQEPIVNCAPGADPAQDADACGETGKKITSVVDAAMDLYNLYIIAADMQEENNDAHGFDFDQYFENLSAEDGNVFAWILDSEDFYEKGPSYAGQDETYRIAQPLLDDFFNSIDERMAGGDTVATFRFAHAETIMPFAALLKLPGSDTQAPAVRNPVADSDVYNYADNDWRGESVTPMAANIQWDVYAKDGIDPETGKEYTPIVRMLYNENEIAFNDSCTPVAEGSTWYKETELKQCLSGIATDEDPRIATASDDAQSRIPSSDGRADGELAETGSPIIALAAGTATLLALAGASLCVWRARQ